MKKFVSILLTCSLLFVGVLSGCSSTNDTQSNDDTNGEGNESDSKTLTMSIFSGGHGEEIWQKTIDMFEEQHPDVKVEAEFSPQNHETLRLNFIEGNPPDLYFANASMFDNYQLINDGLLTPLDSLLDSEAPKGDGKFKDMFIPSILEGLEVDDSLYLMPFDVLVFGQFYNKALYEENGWEIPSNFEEYLATAEKMKSKGIDPFTYPGVYPVYLSWALVPTIGSIGGDEVLSKIENIEEGAWKDPAVIEALERLVTLRDNGYIQDGVLAFDHTQAQMEFANNRAANVVTGTWLENEMEGNWPEGFELTFLGNPWNKSDEEEYVAIATSVLGVPKDAQNPELAMEFMKLMYSDENMKAWAEEVGVVRPIIETDAYSEFLPASVLQAVESLNDPNISTHVQLFTDKYPELTNEMGDHLNALIAGNISIDEFTDKMEEATKKARDAEQNG